MPYRQKYPNAQSKKDHYNNIISKLTSNRDFINNKINTYNARKVNATAIDPVNVDGAYYDQYIIKRDDWINLHGQQIAVFDAFLLDIDVCIANAKSLETMWANRIGVMEEYDG